MKVTLAKDHTINGTVHKAGATLELPLSASTAAAWQQAGLLEPENGRTGEPATLGVPPSGGLAKPGKK